VKFEQLEWTVAGCCGEHKVASLAVGDKTYLFGETNAGCTLAVLDGGVAKAPPVVFETAKAAFDSLTF